MRRVVVTGLGMVTPLACGVEETWSRILDSQSAADTIKKLMLLIWRQTMLVRFLEGMVLMVLLTQINGWNQKIKEKLMILFFMG
jgi:3-oxoacyl-(acyl-carrier-protein) synthase